MKQMFDSLDDQFNSKAHHMHMVLRELIDQQFRYGANEARRTGAC